MVKGSLGSAGRGGTHNCHQQKHLPACIQVTPTWTPPCRGFIADGNTAEGEKEGKGREVRRKAQKMQPANKPL